MYLSTSLYWSSNHFIQIFSSAVTILLYYPMPHNICTYYSVVK
jgi:hypothetical protein